MKLKIMASCALLALAACASNNAQVQPAQKQIMKYRQFILTLMPQN